MKNNRSYYFKKNGQRRMYAIMDKLLFPKVYKPKTTITLKELILQELKNDLKRAVN